MLMQEFMAVDMASLAVALSSQSALRSWHSKVAPSMWLPPPQRKSPHSFQVVLESFHNRYLPHRELNALLLKKLSVNN
jgi:hypothetical protein